MRKGPALFLLLMSLTLLVRGWMPYWVFQARQANIAETYCVSRGIEGNSCQGSCFLKHTLEEQEREHGRAPLLQLEENELVYIETGQTKTPPLMNRGMEMPPISNDWILEQMVANPDTPPPWRLLA
ncbi:MAG: hypothetical protein U0176_14415 [Bacteroidia bacterium]